MNLVITIVGYALLGIYEFIPLYKERKWKEFKMNLVLGITSFIVAMLISLDVKIPSPVKPIEKLLSGLMGK